MIRILFSARNGLWPDYDGPLSRALKERGLDAEIVQGTDAPGTIDYIVYAPNGPVSDLSTFTSAKAVLSLWAGVEGIVDNPTLTQPLARMVDPGLATGMAEWVAGHVLRYHLGIDLDISNSGDWTFRVPPLASGRLVAVLGLGELGRVVAERLEGLGFRVEGWARRAREVPGIPCHSGRDGLLALLGRADFVVALLPHTKATENILDSEAFDAMKKGAFLLNPGRGALIDDAALIAALDDGQIAHATLDVFRHEPLPRDHPYWAHPQVTVTPHIAAATRPESASKVIADNIHRCETGLPLMYLVDRTAGY